MYNVEKINILLIKVTDTETSNLYLHYKGVSGVVYMRFVMGTAVSLNHPGTQLPLGKGLSYNL